MTEFRQTRFSLIAQVQTLKDREAWDQFVLIYRPIVIAWRVDGECRMKTRRTWRRVS